MRKFMFGLLAALFSVVLAASPASAESEVVMDDDKMSEPEASSSPVECTFHLFTYPSNPEEWAYYVGDEINIEITLSDPDELVANIVFWAGTANKGGRIQDGLDRSATWVIPAAGDWIVGAQLFGHDGFEIIPSGDCDGAVKALDQYVPPAHPEEPDVEVPVQPEEPEQPPTEYNPCKDVDPADIVNVTNPDGSISAYSPDGVLCAQIMPQPPIVARPSEPVVQPAVNSTASMTELPRTGAGLVLTAIGGVMLLFCGGGALFVRRYIPYARPVKR